MKVLELLARLLHLKAVLFGVAPFQFHRSTLTLEFRRELLVYCFLIAVIGPTGRFWIYLTNFFRMRLGVSVAFYTAVFMELLDVLLLIVPPCYLLSRHRPLKQLFGLLVKLHRNPLTLGTFPFRLWCRNCLLFNAVYDSAYGVNILLNIVLPGIHQSYLKMLSCSVLSQLTKSTVLMIMYGCAQYLLLALVQLKEQLLIAPVPTSPVHRERIRQLHHGPAGYMNYHEQLWKVCESLNDLFGVPLITYFLMTLVHLTFVCYMTLTKVLLRITHITPYAIVIAGIAVTSNLIDLVCLMKIVGTFARTREELLASVLYVKTILLGVIPLQLPQSVLTPIRERVILCYCYTVAIGGPLVRFLHYICWYSKIIVQFRVMFVASMFVQLGEVLFFIFPPCYLLSCRTKMKQLSELFARMHHSSLLVGPFPLTSWYRKCCVFNLAYECACTVSILVNLSIQSNAREGMAKQYPDTLLWITVCILTKSALMLTVYGSVLYLTICASKLNQLLPRLGGSTNPCRQETLRRLHLGHDGLMEFYEQLWQAATIANELFGPPLLAYLALGFLHTTTIYYAVWSRLAGGLADQSLILTVHALFEIFWVTVDLMFLMKIVGSCVVNGLLMFSTVLATLLGYLTITYDRKHQELRVSTVLVIYSVVLAIVCTFTYESTHFLLSDTRYRNGFKETAVNKAISAIQGQVVLQTFLSALVRRYQKRHEIAQLMRDMFQLKRELFSVTELSQGWIKWHILRKITISQLIVIGSIALAAVEVIDAGNVDVASELLALCVFFYPKLTIICSVSLYYAVMMFLQNLHFALNERLKQLVVENAKGLVDGKRGYARMQHSVYVRSKLNYLTDARCRIVACCTKTHNLYQQMLLSSNFLCMTFIVSQLLYLHYRTRSELSFAALGHETLTCLLCYFEVYCIAEACELVREQSRKTQKLLLRLNLSPMDHKLKQSIEVFALQTLHQPIEFTACRMFTLDYTVLFSIAAAVTNYLIILIQFEMAIEQ
uniref:Gustatory receptor n=1 Tax=Anopheles christyi TaxID=43041 RepID=A0A182KFU2_9DIPT